MPSVSAEADALPPVERESDGGEVSRSKGDSFEGGNDGHRHAGSTRRLWCNDADRTRQMHHYAENRICTAKYNLLTFLPKALFVQYRRAANM